jgi:hypothetical protein
MHRTAIALVAFLALFPAACGLGWDYEEELVGPYILLACDVREQMAIGERVDQGGASGVVPQCVFAAGWNATHIIAAQHPLKAGSLLDVDKTRTNYWIVRVSDGHVEGPLDEAGFQRERDAQSVSPHLEFTRVFDELK